MSALVILIVAVGALAFVGVVSGRYGGRNRRGGVSLRRGPRAHTTSRGRPKVAYPSREAAEEHARLQGRRDGARLSAYRCSECGQWHLGH